MDSLKLEQFLAVADHGHFGRAAEALNLSQQAVSKNIAALERSLGVKLFERGAFGASLTPYGEVLAVRARLALAELRLGAAEIGSMRGSRFGQVRVGVGLGFVGRVMPLAIERFRKRHPNVHVTAIVESSAVLLPMMLRGELDFCVSAPPTYFAIDPELDREPLFLETDVVVIRSRHPLANRQPSLSELAQFPWLMSAQLTDTWQKICREFSAQGLEPPLQLVRTDSVALAKELLLSGDYICLLGRENVARELAAGTFASIEVHGIPDTRPAILTWRRRSPVPPPALKMMEVLRQVCLETHGAPPAAA